LTASPSLRRVVERLREEGYAAGAPLQPEQFGTLFEVVLIPVEGKQGKGVGTSGTFGILVVLVKAPLEAYPAAVQILRLDYSRPLSSPKGLQVDGRISRVSEKEVSFGESALQLILDERGGITEKTNRLIINEIGKAVTKDCRQLALRAVAQKCAKIEGGFLSTVDSLRCSIAGYFWAQTVCWSYK